MQRGTGTSSIDTTFELSLKSNKKTTFWTENINHLPSSAQVAEMTIKRRAATNNPISDNLAVSATPKLQSFCCFLNSKAASVFLLFPQLQRFNLGKNRNWVHTLF